MCVCVVTDSRTWLARCLDVGLSRPRWKGTRRLAAATQASSLRHLFSLVERGQRRVGEKSAGC